MKVNGNDPTFTHAGDSFPPVSNIPIRLEIASRILAAWATDPEYGGSEKQQLADSVTALKWADALIAAHNETAGGEE